MIANYLHVISNGQLYLMPLCYSAINWHNNSNFIFLNQYFNKLGNPFDIDHKAINILEHNYFWALYFFN